MNLFNPNKKLRLHTTDSVESVMAVLRDRTFFRSPWPELVTGLHHDGSFTLKQAYTDIYSDSVIISGKIQRTADGTRLDIEVRYQGELYIGYGACIVGLLISLFNLREMSGVILLVLACALIVMMILYQELLLRIKSEEVGYRIKAQLSKNRTEKKVTL